MRVKITMLEEYNWLKDLQGDAYRYTILKASSSCDDKAK